MNGAEIAGTVLGVFGVGCVLLVFGGAIVREFVGFLYLLAIGAALIVGVGALGLLINYLIDGEVEW